MVYRYIDYERVPDGFGARKFDWYPSYRWRRWRYVSCVLRLMARIVLWLWEAVSAEEYKPMRVCVDCDKVQDLIVRCQHSMNLIWQQEAKHVVVGPRQMNAIECECPRGPYNVPIDVRLQRGGLTKIFGLTIHVLPWFDDIVVLPDLVTKVVPHKT